MLDDYLLVSLGPVADGDHELELRAREAMFMAAGAAGVDLKITGFHLVGCDAVVDAGFVEASSDLGSVLAFPTALLWFYEVGNTQFAGVEIFDHWGQRTIVSSEDDNNVAILRDWLRTLAQEASLGDGDPDWRETAEALAFLVDALVGDADSLRADLVSAEGDLAIANTRIEELERLRDVLVAELTRTKGLTSRLVVKGVAAAVGAILTAMAAQAGATVLDHHLGAALRASDAVVQQCDRALDQP